MELKFSVQTKIQKPVDEVFDAVRDPEKLAKYFATGGASGPLEEGSAVTWRWADHPGAVGNVQVRKVVRNRSIVFEWATGSITTRAEFKFESLNARETLVSITESGWDADEKGLKASYGNCNGWTRTLDALKAWLEHGIILR